MKQLLKKIKIFFPPEGQGGLWGYLVFAQLPTKPKKPTEGMIHEGRRNKQSVFSVFFSCYGSKMLSWDFLVSPQPEAWHHSQASKGSVPRQPELLRNVLLRLPLNSRIPFQGRGGPSWWRHVVNPLMVQETKEEQSNLGIRYHLANNGGDDCWLFGDGNGCTLVVQSWKIHLGL